MAALDDTKLDLLKRELEREYLPYLPPLLPSNKPQEDIRIKNLSRALSAYALARTCGISPQIAAQSVVDDFDDNGIDAIYLHPDTETLYLVQGKLKKGADFTQDEALAFGQGIRKLLAQDLSGFNQHVQRRQGDIEAAVEDAGTIAVLVVIVGDQLSGRAQHAMDEVLATEAEHDERVEGLIRLMNGTALADHLQQARQPEKINVDLYISNASKIDCGRKVFTGVVSLKDLATIHNDRGEALYDKNIRTFLGTRSEVNASIINSLQSARSDFFFLNNGVTVLCDLIESRGNTAANGRRRKFKLRGLSVINGAQTISSAAKFMRDNPAVDIGDAKIQITLIQADTQGEFSSRVTRARNHQNPVRSADFVSLDAAQERLRRDISYLGIRYVYKPGAASAASATDIHVADAARALAMFSPNPQLALWAKKEPAKLLDASSPLYRGLFGRATSAHQVVNAVRFLEYIERRMQDEAQQASTDLERRIYRHGVQALGWILAKRVSAEQQATSLFDAAQVRIQLSQPFDELRQLLMTHLTSTALTCGPLAYFRNGSYLLASLETLSIKHFGLEHDPVIAHKQAQIDPHANYPKPLFDYLVSKAPQLHGLS